MNEHLTCPACDGELVEMDNCNLDECKNCDKTFLWVETHYVEVV